MKGLATPVGAAVLILAMASGCSGAGTGQPSPGPLLSASSANGGGDDESFREPDLAPRERWAAPFAVTAAGGIAPIEPRSVILLAVDSAIAAGMATQQAIEIERPERPEPPPNEPARVPSNQPAGGDPGPGGPPEAPRNTDGVQRPDSRVMPTPQPG